MTADARLGAPGGARWRSIGPRRWDATGASTQRRVESGPFRRKQPPLWRYVDYISIVSAAGVSALGALMILSSTRGTNPDSYDLSTFRRQLVFIGMGVATMILVALIDYRKIRDWSWLPYVLVLVSL